MVKLKATRLVLAENLNRLMAETPALESNPKLAKRSKLGLGTVARARNAAVAVTVDTLDVLAACFYKQPWQLVMEAGAETHAIDKPAPGELSPAAIKMAKLFDVMTEGSTDPEFLRAAQDAACQAINGLDLKPAARPSGKRGQVVPVGKLPA